MIDFDSFINKYAGKFVEFDGVYPNQCMDLMHQYVSEVLGLTDRKILSAPVARSVFENFPNVYGNQYFDRIYNTLTAIPKDGDIIFWKNPYGYYFNTITQRWEYAGHVGISKGSTLWNIQAFEQNNPSGSACHMQKHNDLYNGCLGWLRFKTVTTPYTEHQGLVDIKTTVNSGSSDADKIFQTKQILSKLSI